MAARRGTVEVAQARLYAGVNRKARDTQGVTPLPRVLN